MGHVEERDNRHLADSAGQIHVNLPCSLCGYNVRTCDTLGKCPECGQEIAATIESLRLFGRGGKRGFFRRLCLMNLVASYAPGLAFFIIAPFTSWTLSWVFVGVAPVALLAVKVAYHLDPGASTLPILAGGIVLSVALIATLTYHGVRLKARGMPVWRLPVILSVSSAIQAWMGIVIIVRANA